VKESGSHPLVVMMQTAQVFDLDHAADRADKALDEWILPWRPGGDDDFFDADVPHAATEMLAVDAVAITQQEAWCFIPGKGFDDLLSGPFRGWVGGHVEVQHTPTMVGEDEEDEEDLIPLHRRSGVHPRGGWRSTCGG